MIKVFVEKYDTTGVEMLHITLEGKRYRQRNEASLSFETRRGFGFMIRASDAPKLVARIRAALAAPPRKPDPRRLLRRLSAKGRARLLARFPQLRRPRQHTEAPGR